MSVMVIRVNLQDGFEIGSSIIVVSIFRKNNAQTV